MRKRAAIILALAVLLAVTLPALTTTSRSQDAERTLDLSSGCNMATLTFATGTDAATVAAAISPPDALDTIWRLDNVIGTFQAFAPQAPQASDLLSVNLLDAFYLCLDTAATITMPTVSPDPSGATVSTPLSTGCNALGVTYPDGTAPSQVADAVIPADAFQSIWRLDNATGSFQAYAAAAPQASDLTNLKFLDAVFLCMAGPASLDMPALAGMPVPVATATAPSPGQPMADKWALWTEGTRLRGANIYQRRVYPELDGPEFMGSGPVGPPYTQEDFSGLAALGANYVNISHPGLFTETPPYELDQNIQDNLDNLLDMIAKADMFAVISFRTGPGRAEFSVCCFGDDWFDERYLNDSIWQDQAAQDAWLAMWRYTAERYRNHRIVAGYDLMVEPNVNDVLLDIWDPEAFYSAHANTLYDWNQLHPRITGAIREVDAETPILVGSMAYSAVEWLPYVEPSGDVRTIYVVHQYAPFQYTHQVPPLEHSYPGVFDVDWDGIDDQFNRAWLDSLLSTVDAFAATHGVPVAVNEFGLMRWEPGGADLMDDQMDLFEQRGINHALWVWDPSWQPWTEEVDAFNFRHGPDPEHHADVTSSDLIDAIVKYWGRNTIRPSSLAP